MITFDQVTKQYNKKTKALDNVSIHIEPKEFVIMVGTSGAGKSTFLKLLTREEKPTFGKMLVGHGLVGTKPYCRCGYGKRIVFGRHKFVYKKTTRKRYRVRVVWGGQLKFP